MVNRGFGIEIENTYGDTSVAPENFDLHWWNQAENVDFKLNDKPVTRSGSSRMNKRARAGIMKPTGSTTADADLQQLAWYFYGYLDNYLCTENAEPATGHNQTYTHEFYGGEGKQLPSFRGIAVYDMLKKYLYGLLIDKMKLEVSSENMTVGAEWIYKTEKARIIGRNGETFEQPDELVDEDLFIMFYDLVLKLSGSIMDGIGTAFTFDGNNNHDVDRSIGFGSRAPQKRAVARKRENGLSITTTLTDDTLDSILAAEYGEVGALEPTKCKILKIPLEMEIKHCENPDLQCNVLFPECTLLAEYSYSGADAIDVTLTLESLGSGVAELLSGTEITTDMYVRLVNNQPALVEQP